MNQGFAIHPSGCDTSHGYTTTDVPQLPAIHPMDVPQEIKTIMTAGCGGGPVCGTRKRPLPSVMSGDAAGIRDYDMEHEKAMKAIQTAGVGAADFPY